MPPSIKQLKQSNYMRLLEYAAAQVPNSFTEQTAISTTNISTNIFQNFIGLIYIARPNTTPTEYDITVDALLNYIRFREFEEACETAEQAQIESASARRLAILSIAISGVLALFSIILAVAQICIQIYGDTRLEQAQITALTNTINATPLAIAKAQSQQFDTIATKLEETNKKLGDVSTKMDKAIKHQQPRSTH